MQTGQAEDFQGIPVLCYRIPVDFTRRLAQVLHSLDVPVLQRDALDDIVQLATRHPGTLILIGLHACELDREALAALLVALDTQQSLVVAVPASPADKHQLLDSLYPADPVVSGAPLDVLEPHVCDAELLSKCRLYLELQQRRSQDVRNQQALDACDYYRDMLQGHMQEGTVLTNQAGLIVDINPFAVNCLGYSQEALIGQHLAVLLCGPDSPDPTLDWLEHPVYQAYTVDPGFTAQQIELRRSDGGVLPVSCQILMFDERRDAQRLIIFQDLLLQKLEEYKLGQLTRYDPVTGLASVALLRHFLLKAMARVLRNDRRLAVICVDLDDFHCINENFGYRMGDQLLKSVGRRIKRCIRTGDLVSRDEGDRFLIVLDEIRRPEDATRLGRQILDAIGQPHDLNGVAVIANASLGIALYPSGSIGIEEVIQRALQAKETVKKQGKHGLHLYSEAASPIVTESPSSPQVH